jgi:hypothetical protein
MASASDVSKDRMLFIVERFQLLRKRCREACILA